MSEGFADKAAFLGGFQRRFKEVDSPFGKVLIGSLSEKEHQRLEKEVKGLHKRKNEEIIRLVYMKWGCFMPDRSARMFSDDDIRQMIDNDLDYAVTRGLTDAIIEHCGSTQDDIESLAKN